MSPTSLTPNTRVIHRTHPEYGFGLVRYVEEDAFGDLRLQVAFDHLDNLENVGPEHLEPVADPLADAAAGRWGDLAAFRRKLAAGLIIGENNLTGGFTKSAVQPLPHQAFLLNKVLSPRLLLLSATPHQGDDERFVHLLNLARPDLFRTDRKCVEQLTTAALVETLTRTPKSRAVDWEGKPLFKGHQTVTLDVHWTVEEAEISQLLTEYILKSLEFVRDSDRGTQLVVQLVMHTFHKIAASSWAALDRALQRRLDTLNGKVSKLGELLGDSEDLENGDGPSPDIALPAKAFFENERQLLESLLGRLRGLAQDSKWKRCADLLSDLDRAEPGTKVLVFTQYRVTQELLRERLKRLFPGALVEVVHGDVEMQERKQARLRFENQSRFLVSTEAGGEGVNLQRACHVMVNYDLPWNPMRLQQRIGRLDRYGQNRVVQVFNLRVPDSWDQHISTRILERLEVIQRTMTLAGPGVLEDYREMILGQVAEQVDAAHLFAESQAGHQVSEAEVDEWVRGAVQSVERWRGLFGRQHQICECRFRGPKGIDLWLQVCATSLQN